MNCVYNLIKGKQLQFCCCTKANISPVNDTQLCFAQLYIFPLSNLKCSQLLLSFVWVKAANLTNALLNDSMKFWLLKMKDKVFKYSREILCCPHTIGAGHSITMAALDLSLWVWVTQWPADSGFAVFSDHNLCSVYNNHTAIVNGGIALRRWHYDGQNQSGAMWEGNRD